jgi:DNA-binding helix-hairpin-helix protein with protein kinase domain
MKFFDAAQKPIRLGNMVGQGGEASVYQVAGHAEVLAKIFQPAPRANYQAKLGWMIEHPPENPTRSLSHPSLAWPSEMLFDSNRHLAGYLMPYIPPGRPGFGGVQPSPAGGGATRV